MKFACDKCSTKYNIDDARVHSGKTLRIKCKKCGHVISLKGPENATSAIVPGSASTTSKTTEKPAPVATKREPPKVPPKVPPGGASAKVLRKAVVETAEQLEKAQTLVPSWFVGISNRPVGPVSARAVAKHLRNREIDYTALVWKDGFPAWIPLADCPELSRLVERVDEERGGATTATILPQPPRISLFAIPEEAEIRADSLPPETRSSVPAAAQSVRPEVITLAAAPLEFVPSASSGFADDDMGEDLIDRFRLHHESQVAKLSSIIPRSPSGASRLPKLLAAVGFFAVALIAFVVVMVTGENTPETIIKEKIVERTRVVYRDRPIEISASEASTAEVAAESQKTKAKSASGSQGRSAVKSSGSAKNSAETAEERKRRLLTEMSTQGLAGGAPASTASNNTSQESSGSQGLSSSQMSAVVSKNQGQLQNCYEQSLKKGEAPTNSDIKVNFSVSVGGSGMVRSVKVAGAASTYPALQSCFSRSIQKWMFPSSKGDSKLEFPIVFTPSR